MAPLACLTSLVADLVLRRFAAAIRAAEIVPGDHHAIIADNLGRIAPDADPVRGGSTPDLAWGAAILETAVEVVGAHGADAAGTLCRNSLVQAGVCLSLEASSGAAATLVVILVEEMGEPPFAGIAGAQSAVQAVLLLLRDVLVDTLVESVWLRPTASCFLSIYVPQTAHAVLDLHRAVEDAIAGLLVS